MSEQQKIDKKLITKLETQYPEMTAEFKRIQGEQYYLFLEKQNDYGPHNISVGTNLENEKEIMLSLTGIFFRLYDKFERLRNFFIFKNNLKNEPLKDTYQDISNYSVIAQVVKNGLWGK